MLIPAAATTAVSAATTIGSGIGTLLPQALPTGPMLTAAGTGFLAHVVSNKIVENSVQTRLQLMEHGPKRKVALEKTKALLQEEIMSKKSALRMSIPLAVVSLLVGQIALWKNAALHAGTWFMATPAMLAIGVEYAYYAFFNALDNIQDEVSHLGNPKVLEVLAFLLPSAASVLFLLCSDKFYFVKAVSILFGTIIAKTSDTALWNMFGSGALLSMSFLPALTTVGGPLSSLPGPPWHVVMKLTAVRCGLSFIYEKVMAKEMQAGRKSPLAKVLAKAVDARLLHYCTLWGLTLAGLYPVRWLANDVLAWLVYFWLKIQQHSMNLALVLKADLQQQQSPFTTTTTTSTTTTGVQRPTQVPALFGVTLH